MIGVHLHKGTTMNQLHVQVVIINFSLETQIAYV
jgi:hypothetical protein